MHVGLKPMRFVSLHHHTTFSYLDGFGMPEAHVRRAGELNMSRLAFTEHGNTSSHVKAEVAALAAGVKPIFGCELYTGRVGEGATQRKYHLTVLAADAQGYENLLALVSRSYSEGFYYEPTVSWEMLREHRQGLIIMSGCQGSLLFCSAVGGKLIEAEDASAERALRVVRQFKRAFGDAYYVEVQAFPELELTRKANPILAWAAERAGAPLVATMDCHYTAPEEAELQQVLHNVRGAGRQTLEEQVRSWGYTVPLCPPTTDRSVYRRLVASGLTAGQARAALVATEEIASRCNVTLPRLEMVRYPGGPADMEAW
jgi:DNA polymerase-3 subunit alpha